MSADDDEHLTTGQVGTAVSNAIVSLYAEYLGRGPTRSRTTFGRDLVVVLLKDTLTKAERRLVESDHDEVVLATRRAFQASICHEMIDAVERLTGRTVEAFLSDQHLDPDYALETFVLVPEPIDVNGDRPEAE